MISGFGPIELIIVLVIVLLVFGPKRLPGLGRQLGAGMREFRDSIGAKDRDDDDDRPQVDAAPAEPPADGAAVPRERTSQPS